jgi:glycerol-3-phosphate dehydrogenase
MALRSTPAQLANERFDLIVIGAGINGVAIARDAAMRGLSVAVLDKADISSGTTSWSTRLIHGGLRYLEHYEFGLVRESLRERERLLHNAPHLVSPIPLLLPIYEGANRGPWLIRAGMVLYDGLSYDKSLHRHRMLGAEEVLRHAGSLDPKGLKAGALYYDAQASFAERLAVENALSAVEHGAKIATYTRVDRISTEGAVVRGVEATDLETGESFEGAPSSMSLDPGSIACSMVPRAARSVSDSSVAPRAATSSSPRSQVLRRMRCITRPKRTAGRSSSCRGSGCI